LDVVDVKGRFDVKRSPDCASKSASERPNSTTPPGPAGSPAGMWARNGQLPPNPRLPLVKPVKTTMLAASPVPPLHRQGGHEELQVPSPGTQCSPEFLEDSQQQHVSDVLDRMPAFSTLEVVIEDSDVPDRMPAPSTPEVGMKDVQASDVEFSAAEKAEASEAGRQAGAAALGLKAWSVAIVEAFRPMSHQEGTEPQSGRVITAALTADEAAAVAAVRAKLQGLPAIRAPKKQANPKQATKEQSTPKHAPKEQAKRKTANKEQSKPNNPAKRKQAPKEQAKPKPTMKRAAAPTDIEKKRAQAAHMNAVKRMRAAESEAAAASSSSVPDAAPEAKPEGACS
jgi:hypothetical protein